MRSVETAQYPAGQCRQEVETAVKGMRSGTGQPGLRSGFNPDLNSTLWPEFAQQQLWHTQDG
jgi:hypothetical protein